MDILINDKKENYIGDYISNYYSIFVDIFNNCSIVDKLLLIFFKIINIIILLFIFVGCILPKNLIIWHILMCFVLLCFINNYDNNSYSPTMSILKKNNDKIGYSNDQILNASKFIPVSKKSMIKILYIIMMISIIGYIYPKYSINSLVHYLLEKLDILNNNEVEKNTYNINGNFKLNNNINININPDVVDPNLLNAQKELFKPTSIDIIESDKYNINLNKVDSGLSVFDKKIEPITTKKINEPLISVINNNLNNKFVEKDLNLNLKNEINKEQLYNSLKNFNNIIYNGEQH
jgi:hypothetical protein